MSKMNLPNKLTLLRLFLVPVCVAATLIPGTVPAILAIVLFVAASVTDTLDGKIARKRNLISDFGKFLDPLADKFMVIGELLAIVYRFENIRPWFFWVSFAVIFRELAVTSLRLILVSSDKHIVLAASTLGKWKTGCQMSCIIAVLLEQLVLSLWESAPAWIAAYPPLSVVSSALTFVFTVWSGIDYFVKYGKYLSVS